VRALGGPAGVAALRLPLRPCIEAVVRQLITAPPTEKSAERTFEYMHRRSAELSIATGRTDEGSTMTKTRMPRSKTTIRKPTKTTITMKMMLKLWSMIAKLGF
jgi:hypothetical protein